MRTPRDATMSRKTAMTMSAMSPASITAFLLLGHERRGAADLDHLHTRALGDHLVLVVGARPPRLALQLHAADVLVVGDAFQHHRGAADERRRARAQLCWLAAVAAGQRAQRGERHGGE